MTTTIRYRYNLPQINELRSNGFAIDLSQELLDKISSLSVKVGGPSTISQPVFEKRIPLGPGADRDFSTRNTIVGNNGGCGHNYNNLNRRRNRETREIINGDEWDAMSSFKPTQLRNTEQVNMFDSTRLLLNKLTDKSYATISQQIIAIVKDMEDESSGNDSENKPSVKIAKLIFEIASNNKFYSKLYARLYSELVEKFTEQFQPAVQTCYEQYANQFDTIQYVDADENYEEFCNNNKINECRKAMSMFIVNLTLNEIIEIDTFSELLKKLVSRVYELITQDNKKNEVSEYIDNVALLYNADVLELIPEGKLIIDEEHGDDIESQIMALARSKVTDYKSLSNKSIFKCMDMMNV